MFKVKEKTSYLAMLVTVLCAITFLVVKYFEYSHKFHDGLLPGKFFTNSEMLANVKNGAMFLVFYLRHDRSSWSPCGRGSWYDSLGDD
jgi:heme/copper-type cytochrome/quinol oxidase subunit 3